MDLMFVDETEVPRPDDSKFFLLGGLVVDDEAVGGLSRTILDIRSELGLKPTEPIKFTSRARPARISVDDWTCAKNEVLEGAATATASFLVQVVHQSIARGSDDDTEHWALDNLASQFQDLLVERQVDDGLIIQDHNEKVGRPEIADIISGNTIRGAWCASHDRIFGVASSHVEATPQIFDRLAPLLPEAEPDLGAWIGSRIFFNPRVETVQVVTYRRHCEAIIQDLQKMYASAMD